MSNVVRKKWGLQCMRRYHQHQRASFGVKTGESLMNQKPVAKHIARYKVYTLELDNVNPTTLNLR